MNDIRTLPHEEHREKSILSSCIIFPDQLEEVTQAGLMPDHFYYTAHSSIYRAIMDLKRKKHPTNLNEVVLCLEHAGKLEEVGGAFYVATLLDEPVSTSPKFDVSRLISLFNQRKMIELLNKCQNEAFSANPDEVESLIDNLQSSILQIGLSTQQRDFKKAGDLVFDALDKLEKLKGKKGHITGIPSGLPNIDQLTCGFQNSDLIILASRPSMGKTALATSITLEMGGQGVRSGIFSLEMAGSQLINRMMAGISGLNLLKFRSSNLTLQNWEEIHSAAAKLHDLPIFIDDSPNLTFQQIIRKSRRLKQQEDIQIIFIDYLGFIRGDSKKQRVYEVGEISRELKGLAKELDIPVVLLCQLNRQCETRDIKKPRMSDLRESGDLEQDADIIAFLYRHEQYLRPRPAQGTPEYNKWHGFAELEFAKHRNGPTGTIFLRYDERTTKFSNWS